MARAGWGTQEMRVVQRSSTVDWNRVWRNLRGSWISEDRQSAWYSVIHDIVPTNERLFAIHLVHIAYCVIAAGQTRYYTAWQNVPMGQRSGEWTRRRMAMILRVDQKYIPSDWLLTQYFHFWPPRRQRAILWILAHFVWYRMQGQRRQTLTDYIEYMRRSRWKAHTYTSRQQKVGNYLDILYLDANELQGLHDGATRYKADECQSGLAPTPRWVTGNTEYPDSNLTRTQRWVQTLPDHEL